MTQKWKTNQTMSKIHKPYINGKTKRPGTHQYHYLGPTVVVVAEKLDPTIGQLCFRHNFQMVRNLQKKGHGNEFRGSKNGGREVWVDRKWPESQEKSGDPRWPPPQLRRPDPGESGGGWPGNFTCVIVWRSCFPLAGAGCRWLAGDVSFGPKLHGSQMGQNDPTRCSRFLESFS